MAGAFLAVLGVVPSVPVLAQPAAASVPCAQGLVVPAGGGAAGRFVLCSDVERQVPQLREQLDRLTSGQAANDEKMREIERLMRNVNATAAGIESRQVELARSLLQKLAQATAQPETSSIRQIRRMSDDIEEVNEKAARIAGDRANAVATAALKGAIEDAVASLDLAKANRLIDSIASLQQQLSGVETKIDTVVIATDDSRNATVWAEALRSKARGDQGQARVLGVYVRQGKTFDQQDFSGVNFSDAVAPGLVMVGADLTLSGFGRADLTQADFSGARMVATVLDGAVLPKARLTGVRSALAQAQKTNFQDADMSRSAWIAADFRGADLRRVKLKGANLAHADLRDADLRGADLRGAFLGNTDLRGVKLDGAIFDNTDVVSSLISRNELDAAQIAGLCATARGAGADSWLIVERIPSNRFDGGYEHRRIFDERLYLGAGGHRPYPRCKMRAADTIAAWNWPVYETAGSREAWSDRFSFGVEHPLMQAVGRRDELLGRMRAALAAADQRSQELAHLPQFVEITDRVYQELAARQRVLTAGLAPAGPIMFDGDTATLLALRLRPAVLPTLDIDAGAASWGGFQDTLGWVAKHAKPWPRLFPDSLLPDDLSDVTTRAWVQWTQARSQALSDLDVRLNGSQDLLGTRARWSRVIVYNSRTGSEDPALAQRLGVDVDRLVIFRGNPPPDRKRKEVWTAFHVLGELGAVRDAFLSGPGARKRELLLTARVTDVQLIAAEASHPDLLLWTMEILPR